MSNPHAHVKAHGVVIARGGDGTFHARLRVKHLSMDLTGCRSEAEADEMALAVLTVLLQQRGGTVPALVAQRTRDNILARIEATPS